MNTSLKFLHTALILFLVASLFGTVIALVEKNFFQIVFMLLLTYGLHRWTKYLRKRINQTKKRKMK